MENNHETIPQRDGTANVNAVPTLIPTLDEDSMVRYINEIPYHCDQCDFKSSHESNLIQHKEKKQTPNKTKGVKQRRRKNV